MKHGKGRSYERLLASLAPLEFKIKGKDEAFIEEGDVSEVGVLIDVDEAFMHRCATLIEEVSAVIRSKDSHLWL